MSLGAFPDPAKNWPCATPDAYATRTELGRYDEWPADHLMLKLSKTWRVELTALDGSVAKTDRRCCRDALQFGSRLKLWAQNSAEGALILLTPMDGLQV
jgi:hypothetical protein